MGDHHTVVRFAAARGAEAGEVGEVGGEAPSEDLFSCGLNHKGQLGVGKLRAVGSPANPQFADPGPEPGLDAVYPSCLLAPTRVGLPERTASGGTTEGGGGGGGEAQSPGKGPGSVAKSPLVVHFDSSGTPVFGGGSIPTIAPFAAPPWGILGRPLGTFVARQG